MNQWKILSFESKMTQGIVFDVRAAGGEGVAGVGSLMTHNEAMLTRIVSFLSLEYVDKE